MMKSNDETSTQRAGGELLSQSTVSLGGQRTILDNVHKNITFPSFL